MALRVIRDTEGVENIADDFKVKTKFTAGMIVPDGWDVPSEDTEEVAGGAVGETLGGYMPHQVRSAEAVEADPEFDSEQGYESMTVPELRDLASRRGLDVAADAKKADLVESLRGTKQGATSEGA